MQPGHVAPCPPASGPRSRWRRPRRPGAGPGAARRGCRAPRTSTRTARSAAPGRPGPRQRRRAAGSPVGQEVGRPTIGPGETRWRRRPARPCRSAGRGRLRSAPATAARTPCWRATATAEPAQARPSEPDDRWPPGGCRPPSGWRPPHGRPPRPVSPRSSMRSAARSSSPRHEPETAMATSSSGNRDMKTVTVMAEASEAAVDLADPVLHVEGPTEPRPAWAPRRSQLLVFSTGRLRSESPGVASRPAHGRALGEPSGRSGVGHDRGLGRR